MKRIVRPRKENRQMNEDNIGKIVGMAIGSGEGHDIQVNDLKAYIHAAEEGGYWAEVPALPGCITEGDTLDEVVSNLNEAVTGWLQAQTPEALAAMGIRYTVIPKANRLPLSDRLPLVRTFEFAA